MPFRANIAAILALCAGTICAASSASARPVNTPDSVRIETGAAIDAPRGFVEMCERDAAACAPATPQAIATTATADIVTGSILPATRYDAPIVASAETPPAASLPGPDMPALSPQPDFHALFPASPGIMEDRPFSIITALLDVPPVRSPIDLPAEPLKGFDPTIQPLAYPLSVALNLRAPTVVADTLEAKPIVAPVAPGRTMTLAAMRRTVSRINMAVNRRTIQITDRDRFGIDERWQRAGAEKGSAGDCEDIALEKRSELLEAGIAPDRLLLAIVYTHQVGLHTVLVVRMPDRDVVLDSLKGGLQTRQSLNYSWISIQSPDNPMRWLRVV